MLLFSYSLPHLYYREAEDKQRLEAAGDGGDGNKSDAESVAESVSSIGSTRSKFVKKLATKPTVFSTLIGTEITNPATQIAEGVYVLFKLGQTPCILEIVDFNPTAENLSGIHFKPDNKRGEDGKLRYRKMDSKDPTEIAVSEAVKILPPPETERETRTRVKYVFQEFTGNP
jgi:hypothetical protein